jgi:hypothetical protein
MTLPHPENPQHVENLGSVELLEAAGFAGPDVSLYESLGCYEFAWKDLGKETLFIYRHTSMPLRFDRGTLANDLDPFKEWNWVHWNDFFRYLGIDRETFIALPLWQKVYDLVGYHGTEEIFGTSYWEGFRIEGIHE